MKYKHIIFDWDGTLGKTLHLWLAGYKKGLVAQGQSEHLLDAEVARNFFFEFKEIDNRYPEVSISTVFHEAEKHVIANIENLELYNDTKSTLEKLNQMGVTCSLVSSSPRNILEKGVDLHSLREEFSSIVGREDVEKHKPNPEAFLKTLEMNNMKPQDTLVIGDSSGDMKAGKAVGADTCLFIPQENSMFYDFDVLKEKNPDYAIENIVELLNI